MPTFIDLQNPGKIYYNKDRIIRRPRVLENMQGSKAFNASRFVISSKDPMKMVMNDLSTGIVTVVAVPEDLRIVGDSLLVLSMEISSRDF